MSSISSKHLMGPSPIPFPKTAEKPRTAEKNYRSVSASKAQNSISKYSSVVPLNRSPLNSKFVLEMQQTSNEMFKSTNKLLSSVEILQMLESTTQNQRCLQHNNILSLYCLNERKILCVNCLYGVHRHRSHKVVPLKDCMNEVLDDNRMMRGIIMDEIKQLDELQRVCDVNLRMIEGEMKKASDQITEEYSKKIDEINAKFEKTKQTLKEVFEPVIEQCRDLKEKAHNFRFGVWKAYTMYSECKETEEGEIMKQLLFSTIIELCTFKHRLIETTELHSLSRKFKNCF